MLGREDINHVVYALCDWATQVGREQMKLESFVKHLRVDDGAGFSLSDHDPSSTGGLKIDKHESRELLAEGIQRLSDLQECLYAQDRWAVLIIFQAMDAAGKDSAIKHVMSGINPQGCDVHSFKEPSTEAQPRFSVERSSPSA